MTRQLLDKLEMIQSYVAAAGAVNIRDTKRKKICRQKNNYIDQDMFFPFYYVF